ncbi:kinase-like protein [Xylariaceae sp. FL0255]|nr:kinase-like protein [Xylariaceae sp. FL0255]
MASGSANTPAVVANTLGPRRFFQHLADNFQNEHWEYEKRLGFGAYGYTALIKWKGSSEEPPPVQRMVIKFAIGSSSRGQISLRHEIGTLEMLNGARHIGSILASCDDLVKAVRNKGNNIFSSPFDFAFESFVGITGPAMALEYLELGDLVGLVNRVRADGRRVPNMILWSFFFCLLRATVGIAYPCRQPVGSRVQIIEEIPSDVQASILEHMDFNERNIMLTSSDEPTAEHEIGIAAKLIDFGLARSDGRQGGELQNIWDAARTIVTLIAPGSTMSRRSTAPYLGIETRALDLVGETGDQPFPLPWLDPDLRDLLARCMYENRKNRPTLQEALQIAEEAVRSKSATSYPDPVMEATEAINDFIQELILNVPR